MNKEFLLVYFPVGPTFRNRVVYNIVNNRESYSLFDVAILTDMPTDTVFDQIRNDQNTRILNINDLRRDYPWFIEHEGLPIKTLNEQEYALDIMNNNRVIPSCVWRFAFSIDNIKSYSAIIFCNCDVVCVSNPNHLEEMKNNFNSFSNDVVIGNGIYDFTEKYLEIAKKLSLESGLVLKRDKLMCNDGNFFCFSFKNKEKIEEFYSFFNKLIYEIVVTKREDLYSLERHSSWLVNNEGVQAILTSLFDIEVIPNTSEILKNFSIRTYPEDRFWNWPQGNFETSTISKQDFINKNFEKLKKFYLERGQNWNY